MGDREGAAKNYLELTEDEEKLINQKTGQIQCLRGRRKGKKGNEYDVVFFGQDPADALTESTWMGKDALMKMTWTDLADKKKKEYPLASAVEKLMMQVDERIAFEQSGIATKKLTALNIQKHLDNFNLESQFGTYSKMHALSGGQKVKVVLAAAMWMDAAEKARKKAEKEASKSKPLDEDDKFDAFGNKIEKKKEVTKIPKSELKKIKKQVAALRKNGQEVYTDDEVEKAGYTL